MQHGMAVMCVAWQGVLVSYIGQIRTNTAKWTDERVRLAGEAVSGCLAVKMLGALSLVPVA